MDFQENRQTEVPAQGQSMNQDTAPAPQQTSSEVLADNAQSVENKNGPSYPNGQPYGNSNGTPYQNGQPYQGRPPYGNGTPYPAPQQPYGNHTNTPDQNNNPYRNNMPSGNQYSNGNNYQGGNSYQNGNNYQSGNPYQNGSNYQGGYNPNGYRPNNGYNNNYPYYNRNTYQLPAAEPGSSLANAAMICGILSIIFCFTFTVYPAFMLGSIAVILALLSKGRRSSLFSKARTGIICAVIGLVFNAVIVTSSLVYVFTNPEEMEKFNETFEQIYGESFDDMMNDMMGNDDRID